MCFAAAVGSCLACNRDSSPPVSVRSAPFPSLFDVRHSIRLQRTEQDPLVSAQAGAVVGRHVVVLDLARADAKLFDRLSGRLRRTIGQPGDRPGDFRSPAAIAPAAGDSFVIFDARRGVLSFWDPRGELAGETPVESGFYNGLMVAPQDRRIVLTGKVFAGDQAAITTEVHEFAYDGRLLSSYGKAEKPTSDWEMQFMAIFGSGANGRLLTGSMHSNVVREYRRKSQAWTSIPIARGWFRPLQYPSDRVLHLSDSGRMRRSREWVHANRMMNGVFAIGSDRLLVRFQAFDGTGNRFYYYAMCDTLGHSGQVSLPTRAFVFMTKGDTAFWLIPHSDSTATFEEGIAADKRKAHAQRPWPEPSESPRGPVSRSSRPSSY